MKLIDYFRLSFHNISLHKVRFVLTLIVITVLCALLLIFISSYLSGIAVYESGVEKKFAKDNLVIYTPIKKATPELYQKQMDYFNANYSEFNVDDNVDISSSDIHFGDLKYPYNLRINFVHNDIKSLLLEGEEFSLATSDGKIWLPQLGLPYGIEFKIGQTLPITIRVSNQNVTVNPTVAGIVDGNEVYFGYVYALNSGLVGSLPQIILPPRDIPYKEITTELNKLKNDFLTIFNKTPSYYTSGNEVSFDTIFENFNKAQKVNTLLIVLFVIAIGAVTLFSLSNSLAMSTNDNIKLFVLLKTLGLKNKHTVFVLFIEAIITIVVACLLAVGITYLMSPIVISISDWLWFDAVVVFGAYSASMVLPIYIPFVLAACLTIISIITVSFSFVRISQKYTKQNLSESFI